MGLMNCGNVTKASCCHRSCIRYPILAPLPSSIRNSTAECIMCKARLGQVVYMCTSCFSLDRVTDYDHKIPYTNFFKVGRFFGMSTAPSRPMCYLPALVLFVGLVPVSIVAC